MTPRGVQLWLGRGRQQHLRDTLVMSNLGYFQLQASPGAWTLHLAPGCSPESQAQSCARCRTGPCRPTVAMALHACVMFGPEHTGGVSAFLADMRLPRLMATSNSRTLCLPQAGRRSCTTSRRPAGR